MKKQYVLRATLRNGKTLYLTEVKNNYPYKSTSIGDAMTFTSKAKAWAEFKKIASSNIGYEQWELINAQ